MTPKKLILKSKLAVGDIIVMTHAIESLHANYPNQYITDVRTNYPELFKYNPKISKISDKDNEATVVDMHYPLINKSSQLNIHFLDGYREYLADKLGITIKPCSKKGHLYISKEEKDEEPLVYKIIGEPIKYWLIMAQGKNDFTVKWPIQDRLQEVVDYFQGRLLFVQTGRADHAHEPLRGALNLLGKANLRETMKLVYNSHGCLSGITMLHHMNAAVPLNPKFRSIIRPNVVIAGGRESPNWEAYQHTTYLHTVGALSCCQKPCWKARTVKLNDGQRFDDNLCEKPIEISKGVFTPKCMDLISTEDIIRAIERNLEY